METLQPPHSYNSSLINADSMIIEQKQSQRLLPLLRGSCFNLIMYSFPKAENCLSELATHLLCGGEIFKLSQSPGMTQENKTEKKQYFHK